MSQTKAQLLGPVLGDVNYDSGTLVVDSVNDRVGIGTTNPSNKLHVFGNARIDGNANPYLSLSDGTNTGYFQIASGRLDLNHTGDVSFSPGGSHQVRIKSSGNVGIGTTNPFSKLSVCGSGTNVVEIGFSSTYGNYIESIDRATLTSPDFSFYIGGNAPHRFITNGLERLRIDGAGNVGVGTTNAQDRLDILAQNYNGLTIKTATAGNRPTISFLNTGSNGIAYIQGVDNDIAFGQANGDYGGHTEIVRIKSTGNVGIGTTNPSGASGRVLEINGAAGQARLVFKNNTTGHTSTDGSQIVLVDDALIIQNRENNYISFETNGTEDLRILPSGNVGIGTINPQKVLEVISPANDYVSVGVRTLGANEWTGIHFGYRENNSLFRKSVLAFERLDNAARGKIHILNNNEASTNSASLSDARMTILSSGNVGIGNTDPSAKLDVIGSTIIRSGNLIVSSQNLSELSASKRTFTVATTFTSSPQTKNIDITVAANGSIVVEVFACGDYNNANYIGVVKTAYHFGYNTFGTANYSTNIPNQRYSIGNTANAFSFGHSSKPNNTTLRIPVTFTGNGNNEAIYIVLEIYGGGAQYITGVTFG